MSNFLIFENFEVEILGNIFAENEINYWKRTAKLSRREMIRKEKNKDNENGRRNNRCNFDKRQEHQNSK